LKYLRNTALAVANLPPGGNQPVNNSQSDVSFRAIFRYKWRNEVFILWIQAVVPFLVKAREMQKTYARVGAGGREGEDEEWVLVVYSEIEEARCRDEGK